MVPSFNSLNLISISKDGEFDHVMFFTLPKRWWTVQSSICESRANTLILEFKVL